MKNFLRSLKYLKPYKGRIGVAVLCVLAITVLWGGGLGLVVPGAKILISEEGLHGWAYKSMAEDHLGAGLMEQEQLELSAGGRTFDSGLTVLSVEKHGAASQAQLPRNAVIVGLDGQPHSSRVLLRRLAYPNPGDTLELMVLTQGELKQIGVTLGPYDRKDRVKPEAFTSRIFRRLTIPAAPGAAPLIPEPKSRAGRFPLFLGLLVIVLIVTLVRAVFTFVQEYLVGTAIWLGIMDLRNENYNVVLHMPTTFFSEKGVSDATSRFVQDMNELARGQNTLLGKTMVEPGKAIGALAAALYLSWELTLLAMVAGPPAFFLIRKFGKKMHKASKRALESWSLLLGTLSETLIGIRVVKAYTMEGAERRRFFRVNRALLKQQIRKERLDAATGPTVESLGMLFGTAAAAAAGYMVFVGYRVGDELRVMDREVFIAWMVALFALFDPVRKLAKVTMRFSEADAAAKRIFDLQDSAQEPHVANAPSLPRHRHSLEFRAVSFRYPSASTDAVREVSLHIRAGERVAIVGPNGSGKTTLLSLLPRLIDPTRGGVYIDGQDVSQVSVRSLRRQIGLVTQETVLFHATIGENIAYGLRRPHPEAVLAAARKSYVDEFVRELPAGYDTMVGEHGATLSGGQKQRISIARAILRDPAILIFDEAMSQVDSESEEKIHKAMEEFVQGRTTLLIAHRFRTVLQADRIVVMASGAVVDAGTHDELLKRCELYYTLYRSQLQG